MYTEIVLCLPVTLFLLVALFITGLVCNKALALFKPLGDGSFLSFAGHCALGFLTLAIIYAMPVSHGKTILSGIIFLIFVYKLIGDSNTRVELKKELSAVLGFRILGIVTLVTIISYLFVIIQNSSALCTDYPLVYGDYHFYASLAKGLGITGVENQKSMMLGYGLSCGTLLYHYSDLWLADLIAVITHFNHLVILLFVIYPIMLSLVILSMIGLTRFVSRQFRHWHILLLIVAAFGINIYFTGYENIPLLANFGLKCFPGLYHAHKLLIIYVFIFCSLSQFLIGDAKRSVLWLCFLCIIYPTVIPAIFGGAALTVGLLFFAKKINLKSTLGLLMLLGITIAFILVFDHLFSDQPRQATKLDFFHQIKLIAILFGSYLLKLAIVFFPALIVVLLRFIYNITFRDNEKIIWFFVIGATVSSVAFASENHGTDDIGQAVYNVVPPLIIIASIISLGILSKSTLPGFIKPGLFSILLICAGYNLLTDFQETSDYLKSENVYSKIYIDECLREVDKNNLRGRFVNIALVDNNVLHSWYYDFYQKARFLIYSDKVMASLDISPFLPNEKSSSAEENRYSLYFKLPMDFNNPIEKWLKKNGRGKTAFDSQLLLKYFGECPIDFVDLASDYKFSDEVKKHLTLISTRCKYGRIVL